MAEYRDIAPLKQQISNFKKAVNPPNSDYVTGYVSALSATEGVIAGLPTADVVEVKHGEWIFVQGDVGYSEVKCSRCDKITVFGDEDEIYPYCPFCGAKMDGERKEK